MRARLACLGGIALAFGALVVVTFSTAETNDYEKQVQPAMNALLRGDVGDFFKLQPAVATTYTARLDWYGAADLDLFWRMCNTLSAVGNTNGATQANPETTTVAMPAGSCWILQVTMAPGGANGNGPAFARLQVTTP